MFRYSKYNLITILVLTMIFDISSANQQETYSLNLSGKKYEFSTPNNFSRDFPKPSKHSIIINIYDTVLYNDSGTTISIYEHYFDFKEGLIFKETKGILKMSTIVRKSNFKNENVVNLIKNLTFDFNNDYSAQDLSDFNIEAPFSYENETISGNNWITYQHKINNQLISTYALSLDDDYYLSVSFKYINNSTEKDNDWESIAQSHEKAIISSFK